jgi:plasmid stability protein
MMKKFQMNMPDKVHRELKVYAAAHGSEMTAIVLKLVQEFLTKKAKRKAVP